MKIKETITEVLTNVKLSRPTMGIAFSGGGARGFAHIGVVMAMEKFNIVPDVVSGVSAGAIAASLYASGCSARDMIDCFRELNSFSDFTEFTIPKEGFFSLDKFRARLREWLPLHNLEDFPIPISVVCTDFDHGKAVSFTSGEATERVVASCSIPIIFKPVKINGVNYVDGGVLSNLPAWAIRDNCKTLIGVNCSPLDRSYKYTKSIYAITLRSYSLMTKANTINDLKICDHVIQSQGLAHYGTFSLSSMKKIIVEGYDSASRLFEKIV